MWRQYESGLRLMIGLAFMLLAGLAAVPSGVAVAESPASLTIDVYTCDSLHDPIDPNQTLVNECALGTEDIAFTLQPIASASGSMMASTGSGGSPSTISFTNLASGDFRLQQQTPSTIALSYIAECTSNVRSFESPFSPFTIVEPAGRLDIELLPGEQLSCDWYNILAPEQPSVTTLVVNVYSCSGDVIDPELCELAPNVELRLFNPSAEFILTTDENGVATFDGTGDYTIEFVSELPDRVTCGIFVPDGPRSSTVTLDPANPVTLDAFYCYPGA